MAKGDCERDVAAAALQDGILLVSAPRLPWLNRRGHFSLPDEAGAAREPLGRIFDLLGGIVVDQMAKGLVSLPNDLYHPDSGTFVEVDEYQHFTSFRALTLSEVRQSPLGFEVEDYELLCDRWRREADTYRRTKDAPGFGTRGRQRQRAYNDALRDLVTPLMGHPPVLRIPAPRISGALAWGLARERILAALRP